MNEDMKQSLGLLVVAVLGGVLWLAMNAGGADRDDAPALWALMLLGAFVAVVCAVVGLGRLAVTLLRD